jgi:hypothetical protein
MSSHTVILSASNALRSLLWEGFRQTDAAAPDGFTPQTIVGSEDNIVFSNPTETARNDQQRLSIWLYQIAENEFVKNQPLSPGKLETRNGERRNEEKRHNENLFPPLALNLFYLITPFGGSADSDQLLLGKTMQVMYDNAIVLLREVPSGIMEELRIVLCRLTLEELTRIWDALQEPYRLSVCYEVRVMRIDSARVSPGSRVVEYTSGYRIKRPDDDGIGAEGTEEVAA